MINKAIPHIFNNPSSIFLTTTARAFLFDGIPLNCTKAKEFAANAVCDQIRAKPDGMVARDDGIFLFSMFGAVSFPHSWNHHQQFKNVYIPIIQAKNLVNHKRGLIFQIISAEYGVEQKSTTPNVKLKFLNDAFNVWRCLMGELFSIPDPKSLR